MSDDFWKTRTAFPRRQDVTRPSLSQVLRQIAIIALVLAVWGAILAGYLQLVDEPSDQATTTQPEPSAVVLVPSDTPTQEPTSTPMMPTETPAPTSQPDTPTPATDAGDVATAEVSPSPEPSATPTATALPTPTDTPVLPTDTPVAVTDTSLVSFSQDVLPILENRCVRCHGGERTEEGLVLRTYADVLAGSWNGPVIEPGSAAESYLIEMITSGKMPKRGPRLLPAEVQTITEWVDAGAPDN